MSALLVHAVYFYHLCQCRKDGAESAEHIKDPFLIHGGLEKSSLLLEEEIYKEFLEANQLNKHRL